MEETTFENAKVGDRVYCFLGTCEDKSNTNGSIIGIDKELSVPIMVLLDTGGIRNFALEGNYTARGVQIMFWSKPEFKVPVRPKRKRIIEGYVGVSVYEPNISGIIASLTNLYEKPEQVRSIMNIGQPVFVKIEIEE